MEEESELQLLSRHLTVVSDKVRLCRELLLESPGIQQDELLSSVIGFLEACGYSHSAFLSWLFEFSAANECQR